MSYSKKQLEELFGLSKSGVHNRLRDCGLDSSKSEYTDEEINNHFTVACDMMQQGASRRDVRNHFGVEESSQNKTNEKATNQNPMNGGADNSSHTFTQGIKDLGYNFFKQEAQRAIQEMLPYTPLIVQQEWENFIHSGEVTQAFLDYRDNVQAPAWEQYYQGQTEDEITYPYSMGGLGATPDSTNDSEYSVEDDIQADDEIVNDTE